ncbi:tail assembly chaperone [uncultured Staphylococcus sp.]|uniref:tail assembly chaperone n=1 Tax=uncultured Staphylococcus sp. TaxID=189668 RepID=UPI0025DEAE38|nr:tail assembly chaperone [uncultured Staphylococcus sp.]
MTEFNPITSLFINGEEVKAKVLFNFDIAAKKFATEEKDDKGRKSTTSGFHNIYNNILQRETSAIVDFWECATAYKVKNRPTREQIEEAVAKVIEEKEDTNELLQGALDSLNKSGFFKQKSRLFWTQMNYGPKMAKADEKKSAKTGVEMMKDLYEEIMGEPPYSTTQK